MSAARVGYQKVTARVLGALAASALAVLAVWGPARPTVADRAPVIVQARDLATALKAVRDVGGQITARAGHHRRRGRGPHHAAT